MNVVAFLAVAVLILAGFLHVAGKVIDAVNRLRGKAYRGVHPLETWRSDRRRNRRRAFHGIDRYGNSP